MESCVLGGRLSGVLLVIGRASETTSMVAICGWNFYARRERL